MNQHDPNHLTLLPVVPNARYLVMSGGRQIGNIYRARRTDGFRTDQSTILYTSPQAAADSLAPPLDEQECFDCGKPLADARSIDRCDGLCHARAVEQFDRGQM